MQSFRALKALNLLFTTKSALSTAPRLITSTFENDGLVRRVTLSNPKKRNILSLDAINQLNEEFDFLSQQKQLRVVIIAAAGPVFSGGHDLRELAGGSDTYRRDVFRTMNSLVSKIRDLHVPVIGRIHALAAAAGCQLAAACDIVVALDSASFSTPGVTVGLFCTTPGVLLSRQVPPKVALDMLITGEAISAQDALRAGLVSRIVRGQDHDLDAAIERLTKHICSLGRDSIALGKRAFYAQIDQPLHDAMDLGAYAMVENMGYDDFRRGTAKFLSGGKKTGATNPAESDKKQ